MKKKNLPAWHKEALKRRRRRQILYPDLTCEELAKSIGVARKTLNNWELGKHKPNKVLEKAWERSLRRYEEWREVDDE